MNKHIKPEGTDLGFKDMFGRPIYSGTCVMTMASRNRYGARATMGIAVGTTPAGHCRLIPLGGSGGYRMCAPSELQHAPEEMATCTKQTDVFVITDPMFDQSIAAQSVRDYIRKTSP
jgi:hypothetical protein